MLDDSERLALITGATQVSEAAYAPYSGYRVGAAVVTDDERVFFGCNVENASYGLSLCAERVAMSAAVSAGASRIRAVVVVTDSEPPGTPCGACLQWIAELGTVDVEIILANRNGCWRCFTLGELLPAPFRL